MNVFVSNLAESISAEDLRKVFTGFGTILDVRVGTSIATGRIRRHANVNLVPDGAALTAILELDLAPLKGRPVRVREYLQRERHERRDNRMTWSGPDRRRAPDRRHETQQYRSAS